MQLEKQIYRFVWCDLQTWISMPEIEMANGEHIALPYKNDSR